MSEIMILIVEDDLGVGEGVRRTLNLEGFSTHLSSDALQALEWMETHTPDLILADITMPGMNGYQFYQRIRQNPDWVWIPFMFLTARTDIEDIRYGKEMGVDDYLTKPINPQDLVSAVRGKLIRYEQLEAENKNTGSKTQATGQYAVGHFTIDLSRRQVWADDQEVSLSPTEFDIFQRLILADGAVVIYEELIGDGDEYLFSEKDAAERLRYHIRDLRKKLKSGGEQTEIIFNVRGAGYRLAEQPHRIQKIKGK